MCRLLGAADLMEDLQGVLRRQQAGGCFDSDYLAPTQHTAREQTAQSGEKTTQKECRNGEEIKINNGSCGGK